MCLHVCKFGARDFKNLSGLKEPDMFKAQLSITMMSYNDSYIKIKMAAIKAC